MTETFGVRLQERIRSLGPLCVGVDPSRALLESWGRSDNVDGLEFFALSVLDATARRRGGAQAAGGVTSSVSAPKVIECWSDSSPSVVTPTCSWSLTPNAVTFGPTNEGYAEAWLAERSPLRVDAVTASPYVGFERARATVHAGPRNRSRSVHTCRDVQ